MMRKTERKLLALLRERRQDEWDFQKQWSKIGG